MKAQAEACYEVSFEAANKVGGIYTVIKSKVLLMQQNYPEYYLIGPYFEGRSEGEVEFEEAPDKLKPVFEELQNEGIFCRYGKWQVDGEPQTILIDSSRLRSAVNDWKSFWWENYQIDSMTAAWDFEEPMLWSTAVGRLLQRIAETQSETRMVTHFHEWLSGFGLLWLKHENIPVGKVFTTHATMLGRSLAGSGRDLYTELPNLDPDTEARNLGVIDKFSTERACALHADVFTTVSESTAIEAEKILGRRPEVLVLNGLDSSIFPTVEDAAILHRETRDKMRSFFSYYFFPYADQHFDLEHSLAFFLVGRYEYRNKGIDLYLEALAKLNETLKAENSDRTIVAFVWVPAGVGGTRKELTESKNYYKRIRGYVEWKDDEIKKRLVQAIVSQRDITAESLLSEDFLKSIKKDMRRFHREGNPPVSTHYLHDEANDPIVQNCHRLGLTNQSTDRVKVVFYPVYLDGDDGLLNLSYYDAMAACHLGVFPSYYEPWGYTPIEAAAMGVPAVTTDLAGCGIYLKEKLKDEKAPGLYVLDRRGKSEQESTEGLYKIFNEFVHLSHQDRVDRKLAAKKAVDLVDWKELILNYIDAHNQAMVKNRG